MVVDKSHVTSLTDLQNDVFITIFQHSSLSSLWALSLTCRALHDLVATIGWTTHQRVRERCGISWVPACLDDASSPMLLARLRGDAYAARNMRLRSIHRRKCVTHLLDAPSWRKDVQPVLALGPARTRLVVGAWRKLYVYRFEAGDSGDGAPGVRLEGTYTFGTGTQFVSGLAFLPGDGTDCTLLAGLGDGHVIRLTLPEAAAYVDADTDLQIKAETLYHHSASVSSVSASDKFAFSLSKKSRRGALSAFSPESVSDSFLPQPIFVDLNLGALSSTSLLLPSFPSHGPHLAMGNLSHTPLSLHALVEGSSTFSAQPTMLLGMPDGQPSAVLPIYPSMLLPSMVNVLTSAPPAFPGAHAGATLVSGWFDGHVRLYDLRMPPAAHYHDEGVDRPTPVLAPVMTLSEHEERASITAIATGGPAGTTLATSDCRGYVRFYDVRSPRAPFTHKDTGKAKDARGGRSAEANANAWKIDNPLGASTEVYALGLAGARCFGATGMGPFVFDFSKSK